MKGRLLVIFAVLALLLGSTVPNADARGGGRGGGGGHGGGAHFSGARSGGAHGGGRFHHAFPRHRFHRGGCCWWWPGAVVGGVALGAFAYPYYAYPDYPAWVDPYQIYAPPTELEEPLTPAVQREVVYPHGKYVLYGDGVSQPWQWVWVSAESPPSPAPKP